MNKLKLFGCNKDKIDSLVKIAHLFREDINTEFAFNKRGTLI